MRLIALKITDHQYQDLVHTAHQREEKSLSNHIRHVLEDALAMRRDYIRTSTRLPSVDQLELLQETPAMLPYPPPGKTPATSRSPGRRVKPTKRR